MVTAAHARSGPVQPAQAIPVILAIDVEPDAYWSVVERALDRQRTPYLALAIRSDFVLRPDMTGMRPLLEALPGRALATRLRFTDAVGAIGALRPGAPQHAAGAETAAAAG